MNLIYDFSLSKALSGSLIPHIVGRGGLKVALIYIWNTMIPFDIANTILGNPILLIGGLISIIVAIFATIF